MSGFLSSVGSACGVKEGTQKLGRLLSLPFEVVSVVNKNDERNLLNKHTENKCGEKVLVVQERFQHTQGKMTDILKTDEFTPLCFCNASL